MDRRPQASGPPPIAARLRGQEAECGSSDVRQPDLWEIVQHLRDLEQRVQALEERADGDGVPSWSHGLTSPLPISPAAVATTPRERAKAIPVTGMALLAIAGAYLLRALTEYKSVPLRAGIAAGIVYAIFWLVLAARAEPKGRLVAAFRGVTAALILVPLLWEATVKFDALAPSAAAAVVTLFVLLGLALSWQRHLAITACIATLAGILAALVLLIATRDLAPFTVALLVVACLIEGSSCLGRWLWQRWMVAMAADLAVLFLSSVASRAGGVPDGYAPISARTALAVQIALPTIYLTSTSVRSLWRGVALTLFEATQIGLALLVSMVSIPLVAHGPAATRVVSGCALTLGALFYAWSLRFSRRSARVGKNFYTYSTLGLLFVLGGSLVRFSGPVLALILSVSALLALLGDRWQDRLSLRYHAIVCLVLSSAFSGLSTWATARLLGARAEWVPLPAATWIITGITLLGYGLVARKATAQSPFSPQSIPALVLAATAAWSLAGLAAGSLTALCGNTLFAPFRTALPTLVLTMAAILLAFGGMIGKRREQGWLVYPFMAVAAYKLLVQDLPRGQTLSLFASLFVYGGALIFLPRILHKQRQAPLAIWEKGTDR